jgi:hypothetical protein
MTKLELALLLLVYIFVNERYILGTQYIALRDDADPRKEAIVRVVNGTKLICELDRSKGEKLITIWVDNNLITSLNYQ